MNGVHTIYTRMLKMIGLKNGKNNTKELTKYLCYSLNQI